MDKSSSRGEDSTPKRFAEDRSIKLPLQTSDFKDEKSLQTSQEILSNITIKLESCRGKRIVYVTSKDIDPLKDINEKTEILWHTKKLN